MPITLQGGQQNRQQSLQLLPAYPIGSLPEHYQCSPHCLVMQRGPDASLLSLGNRLGVQRSNRRLVLIASHSNELIEDLTLPGAARRAIAMADHVGQFSPCRVRHLGAHSPFEALEAVW